MTYEEADEYLAKLMGCASKTGEDCLCKEDCNECEYDYESDDWEDAIATAKDALEKQSEIIHCKDCENWKVVTIETRRTAKAGQCELTKWLCGGQGYCMYGRKVE